MTPTRPSVLVALAVLAGAAAFVLADLAYDALPPLPRIGPGSLLLIAVVELAAARALRNRLTGRGRPPHPIGVARSAALARASSAAGALFAGAYVGFAAYTFPERDKARLGADAVTSLLGLLAALALIAAALYLERVCRVPPPPDEPPVGSGS